jgi:hypothetical protein
MRKFKAKQSITLSITVQLNRKPRIIPTVTKLCNSFIVTFSVTFFRLG